MPGKPKPDEIIEMKVKSFQIYHDTKVNEIEQLCLENENLSAELMGYEEKVRIYEEAFNEKVLENKNLKSELSVHRSKNVLHADHMKQIMTLDEEQTERRKEQMRARARQIYEKDIAQDNEALRRKLKSLR